MVPAIDKVNTGRRIKALMLINKLSVQDVRAYLSLGCVQSVYHWLDGRSLPTLENLYALSELLHVPVDFLIVGDRNYQKKDHVTRCLERYLSIYMMLYDRMIA